MVSEGRRRLLESRGGLGEADRRKQVLKRDCRQYGTKTPGLGPFDFAIA